MPRIGIITGVKSEEAALVPIMGSADAPYVRLSGARPARTRSGVGALIDLGVDGILSFGSAGAASAALASGALVLAERVVDMDGNVFVPDAGWTGRLSSALELAPLVVGGMDIVAGSKDKASLDAKGIAAIDMESHIAAGLAAEAGVPFAVLRAVVDPAGFDIPDYALDAVRPDGSISLLPVIAGLCMQPWTIGRLLDLGRFNKGAMESLSGAVRTVGPGLGLFAL